MTRLHRKRIKADKKEAAQKRKQSMVCRNCKQPLGAHLKDETCLFEATKFEQAYLTRLVTEDYGYALCAYCHQPQYAHADDVACLFDSTTFKIQYGDFSSRLDSRGTPILTVTCRLCGRHGMSHGPKGRCLAGFQHATVSGRTVYSMGTASGLETI